MSNIIRTCNIVKDITVAYLSDRDQDTDLNSKSKSLKKLASVFSSYGGVLGKIAQTLSLENQQSNVYDNVRSLASDDTHKYVTDVLTKSDEFNNITVENSIYMSGSLGQVYKALDKDGEQIIIKVKYVNVDEETKGDLGIVKLLINYLMSGNHLQNALIDINEKMLEELDYSIEITNQINIKKIWDAQSSHIQIPTVYPDLCSSNVIVMEFMQDFKSMREFLVESNQDEKNKIGNLLIQFIFENLYLHNIFYSAIHYGNFLIKDNNTLCVLDFGCITYYEDVMISNLKTIHEKLYNQDKDGFFEIMTTIGILMDETSDESKSYCYDFFKLQYEPLLKDGFVLTDEWVDMAGEKNTELMKEWGLPIGFIYLHKIPYGMYHILAKMNLQVDCGKYLYDNYINKSCK